MNINQCQQNEHHAAEHFVTPHKFLLWYDLSVFLAVLLLVMTQGLVVANIKISKHSKFIKPSIASEARKTTNYTFWCPAQLKINALLFQVLQKTLRSLFMRPQPGKDWQWHAMTMRNQMCSALFIPYCASDSSGDQSLCAAKNRLSPAKAKVDTEEKACSTAGTLVSFAWFSGRTDAIANLNTCGICLESQISMKDVRFSAVQNKTPWSVRALLWRLDSSQNLKNLSFLTCRHMPFQKSENPGAKRIEVWASTAFVRACNADMRTCFKILVPTTKNLWIAIRECQSQAFIPEATWYDTVEQCGTSASPMVFSQSQGKHHSHSQPGSIQCCLQTLCSPPGRSRAEQRRDDLLSGTVALNGLNGRSQWLLDDVGSVSMTRGNQCQTMFCLQHVES